MSKHRNGDLVVYLSSLTLKMSFCTLNSLLFCTCCNRVHDALRECFQLVENVSGVNPITAKWAEDLRRENDISVMPFNE